MVKEGKFFEIGNHTQKVWPNGKITCDCMWMTMQMSRRMNFRDWKECKHIKKLRELLKGVDGD